MLFTYKVKSLAAKPLGLLLVFGVLGVPLSSESGLIAAPIRILGCPSRLSSLVAGARAFSDYRRTGDKAVFFISSSQGQQIIGMKHTPKVTRRVDKPQHWYYKSTGLFFQFRLGRVTPDWTLEFLWVHEGVRAVSYSDSNHGLLVLQDFNSISDDGEQIRTGTELILIKLNGSAKPILSVIRDFSSRDDALDVEWISGSNQAVVTLKNTSVTIDLGGK